MMSLNPAEDLVGSEHSRVLFLAEPQKGQDKSYTFLKKVVQPNFIFAIERLFQCIEHHNGWFGSTTHLSFEGYFLVDCVDDFIATDKVVVDDAGCEVLVMVGLEVEF
uniref:Uncharacterized protein n=1 Tax=Salix viminalis TaxID=40686 RepID=A0A6N2KPL3_SALVM